MLRLEDWISWEKVWGKGSYSLERTQSSNLGRGGLFPFPGGNLEEAVCVGGGGGGALGAELSRVLSAWWVLCPAALSETLSPPHPPASEWHWGWRRAPGGGGRWGDKKRKRRRGNEVIHGERGGGGTTVPSWRQAGLLSKCPLLPAESPHPSDGTHSP